MIAAKIRNQRTLLMRNHVQLPAIVTDGLADQIESTEKAMSSEAIRGHEGQAAALYR